MRRSTKFVSIYVFRSCSCCLSHSETTLPQISPSKQTYRKWHFRPLSDRYFFLRTELIPVGALQNVWPCGAVTAEIVSDFSSKSKKNPLVVNGHIAPFEDGVANFQELIFPYGTRKKAIHLKFKCDVQFGNQKTVIESNLSAPFIGKFSASFRESELIS